MVEERRRTDEEMLGRLAHVEAETGNLKTTFISRIDHIETSIDEISRRLSDSQKAPWSTLAAWAAVLISVGTLAVAPMMSDIRDIDRQITLHFDKEGHLPMVQRVQAVEKRATLEREDQDKKHTELRAWIREIEINGKDNLHKAIIDYHTKASQLELKMGDHANLIIRKLDDLSKNDSIILQNQAGFKKETGEAIDYVRERKNK